ncbi:MAG TPA: hypothetical protein VMV32_05305 [Ignavibacteriaceae bacterium]|nr:hypothetical protein [Ignavibacteriaceae bacterium]
MKVRKGFVSNSSTSSFVCDLCGEEYTGWDASAYDADYDCSVCPNGHVLCNSHLKGKPNNPPMEKGCEHEFDRGKVKFCAECGEKAWVESEEFTLSSECCPICQFEAYNDSEMAAYLLKLHKIPREEVFAKIKAVNKRRKKLYDSEYIADVCVRFSLTEDILLQELKDKFGSFDKYAKFLKSKNKEGK